MSKRAVHYVRNVYETIPWATTDGGTMTTNLSGDFGTTFVSVPEGMKKLVGLKPICGAPMRPLGTRCRRSDVTCKRCLAKAKKADLRQKDRGYSARRPTPPTAKETQPTRKTPRSHP